MKEQNKKQRFGVGGGWWCSFCGSSVEKDKYCTVCALMEVEEIKKDPASFAFYPTNKGYDKVKQMVYGKEGDCTKEFTVIKNVKTENFYRINFLYHDELGFMEKGVGVFQVFPEETIVTVYNPA
jgi:hypothetical protein